MNIQTWLDPITLKWNSKYGLKRLYGFDTRKEAKVAMEKRLKPSAQDDDKLSNSP